MHQIFNSAACIKKLILFGMRRLVTVTTIFVQSSRTVKRLEYINKRKNIFGVKLSRLLINL